MTFAAPHPLKLISEPSRQRLVSSGDLFHFILLGLLFGLNDRGLLGYLVQCVTRGSGHDNIALLPGDAIPLMAERQRKADQAKQDDQASNNADAGHIDNLALI